MTPRLTLALVAAALLAPPSSAQMRSRDFSRSIRIEPGLGEACSGHHHNPRPPGYPLNAVPLFYDYPLYAEYPYQPPPSAPAPPQVIVVDEPAPAADSAQASRAAPLLIELQGDHYVRYGGVQPSAEREEQAQDHAQEIRTRVVPARTVISRPQPRIETGIGHEPAELPPAVLVYRDGHREEAPNYAIVGSILYAHGVDWQSGYWSKQIPLTALDLRATVEANRDKGIKFLLPSGPNEVVTRP